jgi:hypothetical protein
MMNSLRSIASSRLCGKDRQQPQTASKKKLLLRAAPVFGLLVYNQKRTPYWYLQYFSPPDHTLYHKG